MNSIIKAFFFNLEKKMFGGGGYISKHIILSKNNIKKIVQMKYLLQHCCSTTRSCRHKAAHCRIGFGRGPEAQRPAYVWSGRRRYPSHKRKDRWWSSIELHQQGSHCNKYLIKKKIFSSFLINFVSELPFLSCFFE